MHYSRARLFRSAPVRPVFVGDGADRRCTPSPEVVEERLLEGFHGEGRSGNACPLLTAPWVPLFAIFSGADAQDPFILMASMS